LSKSVEDLIRELDQGDVASPSHAVATRGKRGLQKLAVQSPSFMLIVAIILVALVGSLPFGSLALYPFALFVTLLHETGHSVAALVTGGGVTQLSISTDLSGYALLRGGDEAIIAPAGYLGATLAGVALLLVPIRHSRAVLAALALIPIAALLFFHPATAFTGVWCAIFAVALIASAFLPWRLAAFLQIFLGVEAGLNAFRDLMTLIFISNGPPHMRTDADLMSQALLLPAIFWSVTWTVLSLILLGAAILIVLRRDVGQLKA
jgi:Peptidase M50B-like